MGSDQQPGLPVQPLNAGQEVPVAGQSACGRMVLSRVDDLSTGPAGGSAVLSLLAVAGGHNTLFVQLLQNRRTSLPL